MQTKYYNSNTTMMDMLFNMLLAYICMFVLTFSMVNTKKNDKNAIVKAEYLITYTWDDNSSDDVDAYVEYEGKNIVFYQRKEDMHLHLDRDDLGKRNDTFITEDGIVEYNVNREIVTIRSVMAGEYIVNAHMYRSIDNAVRPVKVVIEKLNPYSVVYTDTVVLENTGDEKTICRFTIDDDGKVTSISKEQKLFTKKLFR